MSGIFINYRRHPNSLVVASLAERLGTHFGRDLVFVDHRMEAGSRYPDELRAHLAAADVLVAVVHEGWAAELGRRDPDWVRWEVAQALSSGTTQVVPVLLEGVDPPAEGDLPEDVREFAKLQATRLRAAHLAEDVDRLIVRLERWVAPDLPPRPPSPRPRPRRRWPGVASLLLCVLPLPLALASLAGGSWLEFATVALLSQLLMVFYLLLSAAQLLFQKQTYRLEVSAAAMPYRQYLRKSWIVMALLGVVAVTGLISFVRQGGYWRIPFVLAVTVCAAYYVDQLLHRQTRHDEEWPPEPSGERLHIRRTAARLRERLTTWPDWRPPRSRLQQEQAVRVYLDLAEARLDLLAQRDCPWRSWFKGEHSTYPVVFTAWAASVTALMATATALHPDPVRLLVPTGVVTLVAISVAAATIALDRAVKRRDDGCLVAELTEWQHTVGPLVFLREHARGR